MNIDELMKIGINVEEFLTFGHGGGGFGIKSKNEIKHWKEKAASTNTADAPESPSNESYYCAKNNGPPKLA